MNVNLFRKYCRFKLLQVWPYLQATCPARGVLGLPPAELTKKVEERLSMPDVSLENGCSGAFKQSLSTFMEKRIAAIAQMRTRLGLPLDRIDEDNSVLEKAAANISGLTERQLQVSLSGLF